MLFVYGEILMQAQLYTQRLPTQLSIFPPKKMKRDVLNAH
jgi:hypothetical protein